MGIRLKYQILEWKCQNGCGTILSELDYITNKKYCDTCLILRKKERVKKNNKKRYEKKFPIRPVNKKYEILYVLKTNGLATVGELAAFSNVKKRTVENYIWKLRRKYWIKFVDGFYYYFGAKPIK